MFAYENANESHNCIIFNTVRNKASLRFSQISKVKCKPYITLGVNIGPNSFVSHPPTQFKRRKLKLIRRLDISIDSGNGLSPSRRLAIIWTNVEIVSIWHLGTKHSDIFITVYTSSFRKCIWKWRLENGVHFVPASMCWNFAMWNCARVWNVGSFWRTHHISPNVSRILVGNKVVNHSDVVGASSVCAARTTSSFLTIGFNGLDRDNCRTRRETFNI